VDARSFAAELTRFRSTDGAEAPAAAWFEERLTAMGFETYRWTADAAALAAHDSFPDDPAAIDVADRPSVGGVVEFGDPDAGPTLVLNGHLDVVPADAALWDTDPFEPVWDAVDPEAIDPAVDDPGPTLTARGAADMKAALTACVFAARDLADGAGGGGGDAEHDGEADPGDAAGSADRGDRGAELNGRLVVEGVVGEEAGGIGAAAAALDNPYPFERDAAIVAEPTRLRPVTAVAGTTMQRLRIEGRTAHAATRWAGESALPHFEAIRRRFRDLERERAERVDHPLYEAYETPWPVVAGRVEAGSWASTVPGELTAEFRIGVAPGETVAEVESEFAAALESLAAERPWLAANPPTLERFSVQFEPAEIDADEPIVAALRAGMADTGLDDDEPTGATYGADNRHYVAAGIPTVVFGPGDVEQAHFPNESIAWGEVERARATLAATAWRFLSGS